MAELFAPEYRWLWILALGAALFLPVRGLIWVMAVRRAERRHGKTDDASRHALKRRASVTAALLCLVFAYFYASYLFSSGS